MKAWLSRMVTCFLHCTQKGNPMINPLQELGSTWTSGGIGLVAGVLIRYCLVRLFVVFRLFGREWSFDLKDRGREDRDQDPS